jgi:ABC-type branched-subunit amino acid transport system ATPase component
MRIENRVRAGLVQVPGDHAVFGDLSVIDNLRCFGYPLDGDRADIAGAIDAALETFPQLARRLGVRAANLSGGEQRMLGLCKAVMLQPRVLLVDELTIGLAPVVVAALLDVVRAINASGTAVVMVEQSVNVALALVSRVYFMERGRIRFDGPAAGLLDREDLLRAMFLEGAARETLA